jgi:integrase
MDRRSTVQEERKEAERRAEKIPASLVVRENRKGQPVWSATWRDSTRRSVNRTVGAAWLDALPVDENVFIRREQERQRKAHHRERWRRSWKKRAGRPRAGFLDERRAQVAARELVVERELELLRQEREQEGAPATFGQLGDLWLAERRAEVADEALKASTYRDYSSMLARADAPMRARGKGRADAGHIMRAFESVRLEAITATELEAFERKLRSRGLSPATRRKYRVLMRMVLDYAVNRGWLTQNPMSLQGRQKRRRSREKQIAVYTMATVERVAQEADKLKGKRKRRTMAERQVADAIRLAALTGLRQGELLALRWADIDWSGRKLTIARTHVANVDEDDVPKSNRLRTIPLADQAAMVLDRISKREKNTRNGDLIFCTEKGSHLDASWLRRKYAKARDLVIAASEDELPIARFHDLRHTFGTRLAGAGVPLSDVQSLMGHANISTTLIYCHYQPRHDAADRLTAAFSDGTPQEAVEKVAGTSSK